MLCHLLGTLEADLQVLDCSSDKQTLHKDTALHGYRPSGHSLNKIVFPLEVFFLSHLKVFFL